MNECAKYVDDKYIKKLFAPKGIKTPVQKYLETIAKGNIIEDHTTKILNPKDLNKTHLSLIKMESKSAVPAKSENFDLLSGNDYDGFKKFKSTEKMTKDIKNIDLMDDLSQFNFNLENKIYLSESGASKSSETAKSIDLDILSLYSGNTDQSANKSHESSNCYNLLQKQQEPQILPQSNKIVSNYGYYTNGGSYYNNQYMSMSNQCQQIPNGTNNRGIFYSNVKNSGSTLAYNSNPHNNLNNMFQNYPSTPQVIQQNVNKESKNFDIISLYNQEKQLKSAFSGINAPSG